MPASSPARTPIAALRAFLLLFLLLLAEAHNLWMQVTRLTEQRQ
jgi:hypothetical protein